jgi:hypothetical protein
LFENNATTHTLNALDGIQVDDTLMTGTQLFRDAETEMLARFDLSSAAKGTTLSYSDVSIKKSPEHREASIPQEAYIRQLLADPLTVESFTEIQSVRGKLAWLANVSRPDIAVLVAVLSQITKKDIPESTKHSRKIVSQILELSPSIRPRYLPLSAGEIRVVAFSDASFTGNLDWSSQLASMVFLMTGGCSNMDTPSPRTHLRSFRVSSAYASPSSPWRL